MANSKIIVIEGPQGAGKTTITDYLRHAIPYTNLYRLAGTSDSTPTGLQKAKTMYDNLLAYMKTLENQSINLLFDRTFFTEEIYSRLGFKEYSFTEEYNKLVKELSEMDFEIYYITLYLKDEKLFEERLKRDGKGTVSYAKFNVESSIKQQDTYIGLADELARDYSNIHVYKVENGKDLEETKAELMQILGY